MEKCIGCELCAGVCPARCIYVRGADNPPDDPVSPGRALRLRLRDQLPALHPLRPVRRGVPDRGDHRDEAVRVLLHQPPGRDLHQGRAARRRRRPRRSSCRGRTGGRRRGRRHHRPGCAPPRPSGDGRLRGRRRLVGRARLRRARPRARPDRAEPAARRRPGRPTRRRRTTTSTPEATTDGRARRLLRRRRDRASAARSASCSRRNPVHSALSLVPTLFGVAVLFLAQDAALPRRGAGHRLRRRHRRAVPVRDHAARRRPGRGPARSSRSRGQRAGRGHRLGVLAARRGPARSPATDGEATGARPRRLTRSTASPTASANIERARPVAVHRLPLRRSRSPSVLLVIAVVGAVVLARRSGRARRPCRRRRPTPSRRRSTRSDARGRRRSPPTCYLMLAAAAVHASARSALLVRRNPLVMFMCVELMLNAVNLTFVAFARDARRHRRPGRSCSSCWWWPPPRSSVGLGIIVAIFRRRRGATADDLTVLKG